MAITRCAKLSLRFRLTSVSPSRSVQSICDHHGSQLNHRGSFVWRLQYRNFSFIKKIIYLYFIYDSFVKVYLV